MPLHASLVAAVWLAIAAAGAPVPDQDHDGVPDAADRCPDTKQLRKVSPEDPFAAVYMRERLEPGPRAVPVDANGCEPDSDGDGVLDSADYCPNDEAVALKAGVAANGCPRQSDGDGTPDYRDRCPDTPRGVPTDAHGCPR